MSESVVGSGGKSSRAVGRLVRTRAMALLAIVWSATTAGNCSLNFGSSIPSQGLNQVYVPFAYQLKSWYCIPATIRMWEAKVKGGNPNLGQDDVWDWMTRQFPGETWAFPGGGATLNAAQGAARAYINSTITLQTYYANPTSQALADMEMGLSRGNPSIVMINDGSHAVIFSGVSWKKLNEPLQRPDQEYVVIQDPFSGNNPYTQQYGGAQVTVSLGFFKNATIPSPSCGGCVKVLEMGGQYYSTQGQLRSYELDGGRYDGPGPANPTGRYMLDGNGTCYWEGADSGDKQCDNGMKANSAVRGGCENTYWPASFQPSMNSCSSYCRQNGANACEFYVATGECYAEFGDVNACYESGGFGGWYARVFREPATTGGGGPTGRYKSDGAGGCYWDANDSGPNQCTPPSGRYKYDGSGQCYWEPNDSGANQCLP